MAMRLYCVMDGSGLGCSRPQFWHSMPWGRRPQQSGKFTQIYKTVGASGMKKGTEPPKSGQLRSQIGPAFKRLSRCCTPISCQRDSTRRLASGFTPIGEVPRESPPDSSGQAVHGK
jgi:hypothetical protein